MINLKSTVRRALMPAVLALAVAVLGASPAMALTTATTTAPVASSKLVAVPAGALRVPGTTLTRPATPRPVGHVVTPDSSNNPAVVGVGLAGQVNFKGSGHSVQVVSIGWNYGSPTPITFYVSVYGHYGNVYSTVLWLVPECSARIQTSNLMWLPYGTFEVIMTQASGFELAQTINVHA